MNCEICAEKFTRMDDLLHHVSSKKRHQDPNTHTFSCLPCSMTIHTIPDVIEHIESEEHSVMSLATGIHFDARDESSGKHNVPYPPLYFCIVCSCRDSKPFENHLKSATHRKIAWLMRAICRKKKVNYLNYSSDCHVSKKTLEFMNKIINIKRKEFLGETRVSDRSLEYVCDLCNIHFNKYQCYKQHRENQAHKRMEQFAITISLIVRELTILGPDCKVSETFSNSLPPLYYCDLCCIWIDKSRVYVQHTKSYIHKRIKELVGKLSSKRNGEMISLCLKRRGFPKGPRFKRSTDYCKLCAVWCFNIKQHLKGSNHKKMEHFVNSLPDESDRNFILVYIDAQAHMKFSNSPPPNYCKVCNILHSKSEKYKHHLESEGHKQTEQSYKQKYDSGDCEKAVERLRTLPSSQHLKNAENNKFINYGDYYTLRGKHKINKDKMKKMVRAKKISRVDRVTNGNVPTKENIKVRETNSSNSLLDCESCETNSDPPLPKINCELCNFSSSSPLRYDKHLMSDNHRKMRKMLNKKSKVCPDAMECETLDNALPLQYNCELCDAFNSNSQEYDFHLNSTMHKKNQWLLYVLMQRPLSI